ncbi:MAG: PQQ-binding-like beta-propeller repeat protein [Planctomycetota bacterium]
MNGTHARRSPRISLSALTSAILLLGACWAAVPVRVASAQGVAAPIFMDDSALARDSLVRASELQSVGNTDEAATLLRETLALQGDRVLESPDDADLFASVRQRVHELLVSRPELLERFGELFESDARALVTRGDHERAFDRLLFTPSGFDAALRVAQDRIERARFAGALRVLTELKQHPMARGERAAQGALLASWLQRYAASVADVRPEGDRLRARAETLAAWWSRAAGDARFEAPRDARGPDLPKVKSALDPLEPVELAGLLAKPLATVFTSGGRSFQAPSESERRDGITMHTQSLDVFPLVVGDTVFINDGIAVSAWNRFTLEPLWQRTLASTTDTISITSQQRIDEPSAIAYERGRVVALMGLVHRRDPSPRVLVGLDAETGGVLWSFDLSRAVGLDTEESRLRGPVVIDEGVAIVRMSKSIARRRLQSVYVIGIDVETGAQLWTRVLGSAGSLPYDRDPGAISGTIAGQGVFYHANAIGFISAVDSATGRIHWARRTGKRVGVRTDVTPTWATQAPVLLGDRLYMLTPDHQRVLVVDRATGALIRERGASIFHRPVERGESAAHLRPLYLLGVGDRVVAVGRNHVSSVRASDLETVEELEGDVVIDLDGLGVRGRASVIGDRIAAPTSEGVMIASLGASAPEPTLLRLDDPGNVLPLPSQLIVVDDTRLHAYLMWETAERLLRDRMERSPLDPSPAVTFAELSYRASRPEGVLPAVDAAIRAIERDPLSASNDAARSRLFGAVLGMLSPETLEAAGALDPTLRGDLVGRLGKLATSPFEQVLALMTAGRHHEERGAFADAVASYQRVLTSPALAKEDFVEGERLLPAEREAASRLRRLVESEGRGVYAAYDAEAQRMLDAALTRGETSADAFRSVATRYPVSVSAPRAWAEAAERESQRGRSGLALRSLRRALEAAEFSLVPSDPLYASIAGDLADQLVRQGRLRLAAGLLEDIERTRTPSTLRIEGVTADARELLDAVRVRIAVRDRRPDVGPLGDVEDVLIDWGIAMPNDVRSEPDARRVVMHNNDGDTAMWGVGDDGTLGMIWSRQVSESVLRHRGDTLLLSRRIQRQGQTEGRLFVRRDVETGDVLWETVTFDTVHPRRDRLPDGRIRRNLSQLRLPTRDIVLETELMVAMSDDTLVAIQRNGDVAAWDIESGRLLWEAESVCDQVHDISLDAGTLVVAGADFHPGSGPPDLTSPTLDAEPRFVAIEARSGETMLERSPRAHVRWVELTPGGDLLMGSDGSVSLENLFSDRTEWRIEGELVVQTNAGIALPGRAVVLNTLDQLVHVDLRDGSLRELDVRDRFTQGFQPATLRLLNNRLLVATRKGISLFDETGELVGLDARDQRYPMVVPPGIARDRVLTLDLDGEEVNDRVVRHAMHTFSLDGLRMLEEPIEIEARENGRPDTVLAIDGKVLVQIANTVLVIDAPPAVGNNPIDEPTPTTEPASP